MAMGTYADAAAAQADAGNQAWWLTAMNSQGGKAPGGGVPYAATADNALGTVGVTVTGTINANPPTLQVVVTRPAYGDFTATSNTKTHPVDADLYPSRTAGQRISLKLPTCRTRSGSNRCSVLIGEP